MSSKFRVLALSLCCVALLATGAFAAGSLNAYTIMPEKYAAQVFEAFTAETGIKVNFMRFSSGEALARVVAEKNNPQVDVILGGPADTYEAGVKEDVFEAYRPAGADAIPERFRSPGVRGKPAISCTTQAAVNPSQWWRGPSPALAFGVLRP